MSCEILLFFVSVSDAFDLRLGVGILRVKEGFGLDIETNLSMFHQDPEEGMYSL